VAGTTASGSATLSGRGRPIGASTLRGSATGTVTSATCVAFNGTAVLRGRAGTIRLSARQGHACGADGAEVTFAGTARVVGGTSSFAGARGTLSFTGSYTSSTRAVTITLTGRIRY
jgi:hypothetical protein